MMKKKPLWKPSAKRIKSTNMYRFMLSINERYGKAFREYGELYQWSVENIPDFWAALWDEVNPIVSKTYDTVIDDITKMPGATWFNGTYLNFAENLLRYRDDQIAIIFKGEAMNSLIELTYAELYSRVSAVVRALRDEGVCPGDRVVGFMPNMPETVIAMLAAVSIGATWSSCSPDFGIRGVLDRFGQIEPKVLFTANGYSYNGKRFNSLEKVQTIFEQLSSKPKIIVVSYTEENADISDVPNSIHYNDFIKGKEGEDIEFEQLPFDHPLYIMYSSGTTGLPKCMVQGAGGILLHHIKELLLHADVKRDDRLFYFTTCGWMMWNWLISGLALGTTLVLYDGAPFYPDTGSLLQYADDVGITIFGISAKFIDYIQKEGLVPRKEYSFRTVKAILSTGSPLSNENYEFVYKRIKKDVCLSSISGGTDLNGCFAAGNTIGPVYAGELQSRCLAMDVHSFDEAGKSRLNYKGELVCTKPFPSMPLYFWNDPDGSKYHNAYFDVYDGVWRHGDFIEINDRGGVIIYGRSDATLNPGGVRIGTAEIYRVVEALDEIEDSLVVGQKWKDDVRIVLFVKMAGGSYLTDKFITVIKDAIKKNCSPRHLPAKVLPIDDIPYTINMKKVEIAVRKIIHGEEVLNRDALKNPESLELYKDIPELKI